MKIIGHRGARGLAPENTIASFQKALEHGVDEIEFDVRVSKDGIPVLHHDEAVHVSDETRIIREHSYDELRAVMPNITTLDEALTYVAAKVHLLIEVKSDEAVTPIVAVLKKHIGKQYTVADISLGSFSQKTLVALHRQLPAVEKVVIERWSGVKARFRARQVSTKRLNMKHLWLWSGFLMGMQRAGYEIAPYTMNDPTKVRKWEKYLYGVITDYPDRFQK